MFIFKRNTPQLAADGIKGIRIQLRDGSDDLDPFSCGGALHAPMLATWRLIPVLNQRFNRRLGGTGTPH